MYQYRVDFKPDIDSKKLRIALLCSQEQLLGKTKAFDGMTLILPKKLQDPVSFNRNTFYIKIMIVSVESWLSCKISKMKFSVSIDLEKHL